MFDKLEDVVFRFQEIEGKLADPALADRPDEFRRLSQEHASLQELIAEYQNYKKIRDEITGNREILRGNDPDLSDMAKEELKTLEPALEESTKKLQVLLLPKDPNDQKNIVLEMRAGAGGEEAALFVGELFRAYQRYCERRGWKVELVSMNETGIGGYKEIIAEIQGTGVYSRLKYEGGVHRVQRVPETEAQGRVHTSTITVAVMAEVEEVDVQINPADLRIDVYRAGGKGGQGVNTTDSAVRITHNPSGLVVVCQAERSQIKNKDRAMKVLRSRLYDLEQAKVAKAEADQRRSMVGTGDRSERIRTYNFPQGRLTDHRIGMTLYQLPTIMEGDLDQIFNGLQTYYQAEALRAHGYAVDARPVATSQFDD